MLNDKLLNKLSSQLEKIEKINPISYTKAWGGGAYGITINSKVFKYLRENHSHTALDPECVPQLNKAGIFGYLWGAQVGINNRLDDDEIIISTILKME